MTPRADVTQTSAGAVGSAVEKHLWTHAVQYCVGRSCFSAAVGPQSPFLQSLCGLCAGAAPTSYFSRRRKYCSGSSSHSSCRSSPRSRTRLGNQGSRFQSRGTTPVDVETLLGAASKISAALHFLYTSCEAMASHAGQRRATQGRDHALYHAHCDQQRRPNTRPRPHTQRRWHRV